MARLAPEIMATFWVWFIDAHPSCSTELARNGAESSGPIPGMIVAGRAAGRRITVLADRRRRGA
jgi:hypothetical protein